MKLTCMVCCELLVPSDDVSVGPCGHYLHYTCWIEWLERVKNCPQCRAKTSPKQLVKLFLNVARSAPDEEDAATLTNKIDSLTFELRCKNKDIENAKELIQTTKNQNTGLREEILKYREEADNAKATCATLQEKVRYLQRQNKEVEDVKRECEKLRTQIGRLKNLETVLRGSSTEVENMVQTTPCTPEAVRNLSLFCSSLKSVLEESKQKRNQLRDLYDSQNSELKKLKEEYRLLRADLETANSTNRLLQEDIKHLEEEKKSLNKKISELEAAIVSPTLTSTASKALKRLISESPAPSLKRTLDDSYDDHHTPILTVPGRSSSLSQPTTSQPIDTTESPLFGIKPKVVKGNTIQRSLSTSKISIFSNRLLNCKASQPKATSTYSEGYDGLGGHSKVDEFPTPMGGATKKLKPSTSTSVAKKKLSALAGVPKLTRFDGFLDLN